MCSVVDSLVESDISREGGEICGTPDAPVVVGEWVQGVLHHVGGWVEVLSQVLGHVVRYFQLEFPLVSLVAVVLQLLCCLEHQLTLIVLVTLLLITIVTLILRVKQPS